MKENENNTKEMSNTHVHLIRESPVFLTILWNVSICISCGDLLHSSLEI